MGSYSGGSSSFIENDAAPGAGSADRAGDKAPPDEMQNDFFDINPVTFMQSDWPIHSHGGVSNSLVVPATSSAPPIPNGLTTGWIPTTESSQNNQADCRVLPVNGPDNTAATNADPAITSNERNGPSVPQSDLRQSFIETYFEYCYAWCPVLDRSAIATELARSPLLDNALALVGRHVRPPLIPQPEPGVYYDRARRLFYDDEEDDLLISLKAVSLFYWWAPRPPSVAHRHSSWWWTGVIIKHAQQAGFHRESAADEARSGSERSCRRRIWWTIFVSVPM